MDSFSVIHRLAEKPADLLDTRRRGGTRLTQDGTWLPPALCLGQGCSLPTQRAARPWFEDIRWTPRPQPNPSILDPTVPFPSSRSPHPQKLCGSNFERYHIHSTPQGGTSWREIWGPGGECLGWGHPGEGTRSKSPSTPFYKASLRVGQLGVVAVLCGYSVAKACIDGSGKQPRAAPAWGLQLWPVGGLWCSLLPPSGSIEKGQVGSLIGRVSVWSPDQQHQQQILGCPGNSGSEGSSLCFNKPPLQLILMHT